MTPHNPAAGETGTFWRKLAHDVEETALTAAEGALLTAAAAAVPLTGPAWLIGHWIRTLDGTSGNAPAAARTAGAIARWPGDRTLDAVRRTAKRCETNITVPWSLAATAAAVTAGASIGLHAVYHAGAGELETAAFAALLTTAFAGTATATIALVTGSITTVDRIDPQISTKRR